jgi:transcriptional regulator with XRE-family HTH domain
MKEGQRIRRIRESLGWKLKYVAAEVGISITTLSRIERGLRVLDYRLAVRLARVLGCDLGAFDEGLGGPLRSIVAGMFRNNDNNAPAAAL